MLNFALVNKMTRFFVWLRRIHHCRGFGIQSPTDYSFVRDVVNEQSPYYAYGEVGTGDTWQRSKIGRLCLRLANYMQPDVIADLTGYVDYLRAGCRHAIIADSIDTPLKGASLVIARANIVSPTLLANCGAQTMLVVEDIGTHGQQWQQVLQWPAVTVSFDLYYCGIATFNPGRAKQNYIVNF